MSESSSSGIGFCGLLTILFIGLKLGNVISWSWFYVLLPAIAPLAVLAVIGLIALAIHLFS